MFIKKYFAFSLVEMLMALLVVSLLLAALAPVMTRRFADNVNVSATGGTVPKTFCAYVNNGNELLVKDTETEGCIVPDNTYSMNVIMASGGGGGAGAVDSIMANNAVFLSNTASTGAANNATHEEVIQSFDKSYKDFKVTMTSGGGGSGGGNYGEAKLGRPEKQQDCEPFGVYISAEHNGGNAICVSKYNPGENRDGSPNSNISGIKNVPVGTKCTSGNCCWYGNNNSNYQTAANGCDAANGGYSGCYRTVCQWNAAKTICSNWKPINGHSEITGRLPNLSEADTWITHITKISIGKAANGLQFCDSSKNQSSSYCASLANKCPDSGATIANTCFPQNIWIDYMYQEGHYGYVTLGNGILKRTGHYNTYADGVRCALDKTFIFNPYQGGAGSSGSTIEISIPDNIITLANANNNAKIRTLAGYGGKGSVKETAVKGTDGSSSWIGVYDGSNLLWALLLPGGNAGTGASKTAAGANASETSNICTYYDSTNSKYNNPSGVNIECNKIPAVTSFTRGTVSIQGTTCTYESEDNKAVCNDGTSGQGGKINITYKKFYPGIGGGGGAAGTVAHFKNIQVRPKDLIKVTAGHGGKGGNISNNGDNGGDSIIEISREGKTVSKYEIVGGGGGITAKQADIINNKPAEISKPGTQSGLTAATKGKLSSNDEYYPKNSADTIGAAGIFSTNLQTSAGGNGGTNPKISPLTATDGDINGVPCGGLNTQSVIVNEDTTWACNNTSNIPFSLSRILADSSFNNDIISNLAAGSTGGGGGGWKYDASPQASGGAKGMGGYVFIYFGKWGG